MARINVESELFMDQRFKALARRHAGDEDHALGLVVRWWLVAQKWWGKEGRQLVPNDIFELGDFGDLVTVGLAIKRDDGWYAKGSEERFKWYADNCDKARNARAQRKEAGALPEPSRKRSRKAPVRTKKTEIDSTGIVLPIINTAANSDSPVDNCISETPLALGPVLNLGPIAPLNPGDNPNAPDKPTGRLVWEAYKAAYMMRYHVEPQRNAKVNKQIGLLVQRLGLESAVEVVGFYVSHNDYSYTRKQHPIGLCLMDAEGLYTQWRTGRQMTTTQAHQQDRTQSNKNAAQGAMDILMGRKEGLLEIGK